jgi:hypothetical protein
MFACISGKASYPLAGGGRDESCSFRARTSSLSSRRHRQLARVDPGQNRENAADYASDLDLFKSSIEFVKGRTLGEAPWIPTRRSPHGVRELAGVSWSRARSLCAEGRVTVDGERCLDPAARIAPGAVVVVDARDASSTGGPLRNRDRAFRQRPGVVDKPAGMLTVADEDGSKETLAEYARVCCGADRSGKDAGSGSCTPRPGHERPHRLRPTPRRPSATSPRSSAPTTSIGLSRDRARQVADRE